MNLVVALMVKNESERIETTIKSISCIKGIVRRIYILDTGSTDDTVQKAKQYADAIKIEIDVEYKKWPVFNYSDARNHLIKHIEKCEKDDVWVLMIDSNDEIRMSSSSVEKHEQFVPNDVDSSLDSSIQIILSDPNCTIARVDQNLYFSSKNEVRKLSKVMFKIHKGHMYKGAVHEVLCCGDEKRYGVASGFYLYQDRESDTGAKRTSEQEYDMLMLDAEGHGEEWQKTRAYFYLGQNCRARGMNGEAIKWYKKRYEAGGFIGEVYLSALYIGKMKSDEKKYHKATQWFHNAIQTNPCRVEAYCDLADLNYLKGGPKDRQFLVYSHLATLLPDVDENSPDNLFYESEKHSYLRWHQFSIAAYYCEHMRQKGYEAVKRAYEAKGKFFALDERNKKCYEKDFK